MMVVVVMMMMMTVMVVICSDDYKGDSTKNENYYDDCSDYDNAVHSDVSDALICYTFAGPSNILLPSTLFVDISSFKVWMIFSYSPFCKFHSDSINVVNNLLQ